MRNNRARLAAASRNRYRGRLIKDGPGEYIYKSPDGTGWTVYRFGDMWFAQCHTDASGHLVADAGALTFSGTTRAEILNQIDKRAEKEMKP